MIADQIFLANIWWEKFFCSYNKLLTCTPRGSWLTARRSGLVMILYASLSLTITSHSHSELYLYFVRLVILYYLVMVRRSAPSMRGAFTKHQRANMLRYSVSVMPPWLEPRSRTSWSSHFTKMKDYFANKKPIRVIPPKFWSLDSSLSVTHLMDTLLD